MKLRDKNIFLALDNLKITKTTKTKMSELNFSDALKLLPEFSGINDIQNGKTNRNRNKKQL